MSHQAVGLPMRSLDSLKALEKRIHQPGAHRGCLALLQGSHGVFLGAGSVRKSHLLPAPGLILEGPCCELRLARPCELPAGISTLPECCCVLAVTIFRVRNEGQWCWITSEWLGSTAGEFHYPKDKSCPSRFFQQSVSQGVVPS